MKELSIEEKAKRYDEAIERAGKIHNEHKAQPFNVMLKVFPELKESEDERIRGAIIDYLKDNNLTEWAAWLEKQGEQKQQRMVSAEAKEAMYNKPAWSEEDEDILNTIINHFKVDIECTDEDDVVRWLKSIKDRVQPKQEWDEEDEKMKNAAIMACRYMIDNFENSTKDYEDAINWLKSLRPGT